jgi:formylglycine-generating enzyme required for sulfatase activity
MANLVIKRLQRQAEYFVEDLGAGVELEMVLIPGGSFMMGSPENDKLELERSNDEGPQHLVTIKPFCMGKYPITQNQWQAVTALPQVNRKLKSDPSRFKGANRPVESISWDEAVEFCDRLSRKTQREYRLPSEAEWEYACRAGTTTPFHFGETITTDLANYRGTDNEGLKWSGAYGRGPKGIYREETTPVGNFKVANAFGLFDMHGNVWEWCADHRHDDYEGAPNDGSAWVDEDRDENDNRSQKKRVLRGGSWFYSPGNCRSADRLYVDPGDSDNVIGFRIVHAAAWTL